jgi:Fic family protein
MGPDNPLRPPSPGELPGLLAALDARMARNDAAGRDTEAALRSAVELHHRIGTLHPFSDGNGRVARLAMNHQLRRFGHAYVIYPPLSESERFWNVLLGAGRGDFEPLVSFARTCRFRI